MERLTRVEITLTGAHAELFDFLAGQCPCLTESKLLGQTLLFCLIQFYLALPDPSLSQRETFEKLWQAVIEEPQKEAEAKPEGG